MNPKAIGTIACLVAFGGAEVFNMRNYKKNFLPATNNTPYLETKKNYTPDDIFDMVEKYGEKGRKLYIQSAKSYDVAVPLFGSLFFYSIYNLLWDNPYYGIPFAVLMCVCDWIENINLSKVCKDYPEKNLKAAKTAKAMTFTKNVGTLGLIALIVSGIIIKIVNGGK